MGLPVEGKSIFPIHGEFDPRVVRESAVKAACCPPRRTSPCPRRRSARCPPARPCSARLPAPPVFFILNKLKVPVNGDIGCYTLGFVPPLSAVHTCGCMGAGISRGRMARPRPAAPSTTWPSSAIPLSSTAHPGTAQRGLQPKPVTTIIMDNRITGMTGHQDNPGSGRTLQGRPAPEVELELLVARAGRPARENRGGS